MTYGEMLKEVEALRAEGHTIGFVGHKGEFTCEFDGQAFKHRTPIEAFEVAKRKMMVSEDGK